MKRDPILNDETWHVDSEDAHALVGDAAHDTGYPVATFAGTTMCAQRARLAAQAPAMARLLLELEWIAELGYEGLTLCYVCGNGAKEAHKADCALVAVLRAAGVLQAASSSGSEPR